MKFEARRYTTEEGKEPFGIWLKTLRDVKARVAILKRIERLEGGNFGECRPCRGGVSELVIDFGPGYRIYFGKIGRTIILLLCAGDKGTQQADIDNAVEYLKDFKERTK